MRIFKNLFCYIFYGHSYETQQKYKTLDRLIDQKDEEIRKYEIDHPNLWRKGHEKEYWASMKLIREKGKLIDQLCNLSGYENPYANPISKAIVEGSIDHHIDKHLNKHEDNHDKASV